MIRRFLRSAGRASLHVTPALSLLLFVAVAAMWVRAHWRQDVVRLSRSGEVVASGDAGAGADAAQRAFAVRSLSFHQGDIMFQAYRMNVPDEAREESSIAWGRWRPEHHNYPPHGLGDWPGKLSQELWYWRAQATPPPPGRPARGWDASVAVPMWPVLLVLGLLPAWRARSLRRRRRRLGTGRCRRCGYDLRATPGRCPECGTPAGEAAGGRLPANESAEAAR